MNVLPLPQDDDDEEEGGGLLPEEDVEISGSYRAALSSNTPLGQAVSGACDELDALGALVSSRGMGRRVGGAQQQVHSSRCCAAPNMLP